MKDQNPDDGALLAEFLSTGRGAPFEQVVRRHHALVLGVCLRILGRSHDAEDAAQAVFLTLAHKARTLQDRASVAGWLYQTAWNVSQDVRKSAALRRVREREAGEMREQGREESWERVRPLLDQELRRLPEKYRLPVILHHLEDRTERETAEQLGCNLSTLSMRLSRGREMLRSRLARAGVTLSSGVLFALIAEHAASAASPAFVTSTVKAATLVAAGKGVEGVVSTQVGALVKGGLKAMMWTKIKIAAAAMAVSLAGTGGGVVAYQAFAPQPPPPAVQAAAQDTLPPPIPAEKFESLHKMLKPTAEEFAGIWELPWEISVQEARRKAAAQDKPILVFFSNLGSVCGTT